VPRSRRPGKPRALSFWSSRGRRHRRVKLVSDSARSGDRSGSCRRDSTSIAASRARRASLSSRKAIDVLVECRGRRLGATQHLDELRRLDRVRVGCCDQLVRYVLRTASTCDAWVSVAGQGDRIGDGLEMTLYVIVGHRASFYRPVEHSAAELCEPAKPDRLKEDVFFLVLPCVWETIANCLPEAVD